VRAGRPGCRAWRGSAGHAQPSGADRGEDQDEVDRQSGGPQRSRTGGGRRPGGQDVVEEHDGAVGPRQPGDRPRADAEVRREVGRPARGVEAHRVPGAAGEGERGNDVPVAVVGEPVGQAQHVVAAACPRGGRS
jgi:hypothetical protein